MYKWQPTNDDARVNNDNYYTTYGRDSKMDPPNILCVYR